MKKEPEDVTIDRILRVALHGRASSLRNSAAPGDDCLDAERLAAWSAGAVSPDERDRIELHVSTCARCQELTAAFMVTEPAPATVLPFHKPKAARWIYPVAAAAAAAAIAIAVWPESRESSDVTTMARADQEISQPVSAPPPAPTSPADAAANAPARQTQSGTPTDALRRAEPGSQPKAAPVPPAEAVPVIPTPPPAAAVPPGAVPTGAALPPPPAMPPPPTAPPPPPPVTTGAVAATPPPPPTMPATRAERESRIADPRAVVVEFSSADLAQNQAVSQVGQTAARAGGGRGGGGRGARVQIAVDAVAVPRWRVLAGGAVERTSDAGTTWTAITIDPPVHVIGGFTPAPGVCWLIARDGIVLLSVDATAPQPRFQRRPFLDGLELVSIRATSAREATVTAADGRVFVTTDGGTTWRLQGFQPPTF